MGKLRKLVDLGADDWAQTFATNVTGAALITAAAIPYLAESSGTAVYLTSISASMTPPWPGLGSYAVSKAALDKLVEAWRAEHPALGVTRVVVGDCGGDPTIDAQSQFNVDWDHDLMVECGTEWFTKGYLSGTLMDVGELLTAIDTVLHLGASASVPSISVIPRRPATT